MALLYCSLASCSFIHFPFCKLSYRYTLLPLNPIASPLYWSQYKFPTPIFIGDEIIILILLWFPISVSHIYWMTEIFVHRNLYED